MKHRLTLFVDDTQRFCVRARRNKSLKLRSHHDEHTEWRYSQDVELRRQKACPGCVYQDTALLQDVVVNAQPIQRLSKCMRYRRRC